MREIVDIEKVTDDWMCESHKCATDAEIKFTEEISSTKKVDHYLCRAHAFLDWGIDADKVL